MNKPIRYHTGDNTWVILYFYIIKVFLKRENILSECYTRHGEYLTKLGYWLIKGGENDNVDISKFWKKFWKQKFWSKWKIFYWKLANGALAPGVNLRKRKILSEIPCPLCGKEEEMDTHLFKNCEVTMRIWKSSNLGINLENPVNTTITVWYINWLWYLMQEERSLEGKTLEF